MIEVKNLTKHYGSQVAVDNVSFKVPDGKITAFLGNNGAGKSTTMRMILGLDNPTAGTSTINGTPYTHIPSPLKTVGSLLDASAVNPKRTASEHLRINAVASGLSGDNIPELLELVGLSKAGKKHIGQFSLGMHQRLGIATALLGDPSHVILDEPTNGLDPDAIKWLRGLISNMAEQGKSVLMSSHQLSEVASIADDVVIIEQGKIIHTSSMQHLHDKYNSKESLVLSSDQELLKDALVSHGAAIGHDSPEGFMVSGMDQNDIGHIAYNNGIVIYSLVKQEKSLEDIFFTIVNSSK